MSHSITFHGNQLTIDDTTITLENFPRSVIELEGCIVVLTLQADGYFGIDNVIGLINDKIAWQIEDARNYNQFFPATSYVDIRQYAPEPALFIATDFDGHRFLVNPQNGKIVGRESNVK